MAKQKQSVEKTIYISFERVSKKIKELINLQLSKKDLKISFEQWLTLEAISRNQGINQKDLAQMIAKETASVSRLIKKLIGLKLISIQKDNVQKKSNKLYLAPSGFELIQQVKKSIDKEFKSIFSAAHEQELNLMMDILKRINKSIDS